MNNTFELGHCRLYKAIDDMVSFSEYAKSDCKRCVYFSSFNCGVSRVQNSVGEHWGSMY